LTFTSTYTWLHCASQQVDNVGTNTRSLSQGQWNSQAACVCGPSKSRMALRSPSSKHTRDTHSGRLMSPFQNAFASRARFAPCWSVRAASTVPSAQRTCSAGIWPAGAYRIAVPGAVPNGNVGMVSAGSADTARSATGVVASGSIAVSGFYSSTREHTMMRGSLEKVQT
jgi:hypothetical protein